MVDAQRFNFLGDLGGDFEEMRADSCRSSTARALSSPPLGECVVKAQNIKNSKERYRKQIKKQSSIWAPALASHKSIVHTKRLNAYMEQRCRFLDGDESSTFKDYVGIYVRSSPGPLSYISSV